MEDLSDICIRALKYYTGDESAYPGLPADPKAYVTINSLFFPGTDSEKTRAAEGRKLNADFLLNEETTLSFCCDLMDALMLGGKGEPEAHVYRVDRKIDVDRIRNVEHTVSFTSTSTDGFLSSYADKKDIVLLDIILPADAPRAEMSKVLPDYSKPEEAEVLLPPWLKLTFAPEPRPLTDEERMIRDMNGNPPVCAWVVKAGSTLDYPSPPSHPAWMEISAKYGKRVFDALMAGSDMPPSDGEMYAQWKQVFRARLSQRIQGITLTEALQQTLNNQRDLTEKSYLVKDILIKDNAAEIMYHVLGIDPDSAMGKRIQSCTAERLIHALATYLLGCYCRDSFNLSFDALPRIFSSKTTGNAFLFYHPLPRPKNGFPQTSYQENHRGNVEIPA